MNMPHLPPPSPIPPPLLRDVLSLISQTVKLECIIDWRKGIGGGGRRGMMSKRGGLFEPQSEVLSILLGQRHQLDT